MVPLAQQLTVPGPGGMRWIRVEDASAAASARSTALVMARQLGFSGGRAEGLALACTEAATNLSKHAQAGSLLLRRFCAGTGQGIELVTIDRGPGMADVRSALRDGHSTAGTLGIGLGAIRRNADFCDVYSLPGRGTTLVARFLPGPGESGEARWSGLTRSIDGETECGDAYAAVRTGSAVTAVLSDGLGHGPLAAAASREALRAFAEGPEGEPAALLEQAHRRMSGTRGGAVAVVQIEGTEVRFAGIGNVAGWIVSGKTRRGMVSVPGITGHQARRLRQYTYQIGSGESLVLHSDGLSSRWDITSLPGLTARDPLVMAAALLSEAGTHRDDASVLVLRS